ncbi:RHS repeat domain-containing protein [Planctomycetaceae bacterium SH139]
MVVVPQKRAVFPVFQAVCIYASYIDEPVLRYEPSATETLYYHRNQQYSIIALTDNTGAITERYAYSAYGEPVFVSATGTVLADSADDNRYTYTGREWDGGLGLYHFRARMYDAGSGRFATRDPIKYLDGESLYRCRIFLANVDPQGTIANPVSDSDPVGILGCGSWQLTRNPTADRNAGETILVQKICFEAQNTKCYEFFGCCREEGSTARCPETCVYELLVPNVLRDGDLEPVNYSIDDWGFQFPFAPGASGRMCGQKGFSRITAEVRAFNLGHRTAYDSDQWSSSDNEFRCGDITIETGESRSSPPSFWNNPVDMKRYDAELTYDCCKPKGQREVNLSIDGQPHMFISPLY